MTTSLEISKNRIAWVDYAKGVCIILVVLMHSTLGVEKAMGQESFLHGFIEWARPFRMPDFFLIAGLFLSRRINRPWRSYFDTKVLHFIYFYVIWMSIWYVLKLPQFIGEMGAVDAVLLYPLSFVQPLGTLWFIYLLPVFFVFTKFTRNVPVIVIFVIAAGLHATHLDTGVRVFDEFGSRFVFFYSGYAFAPIAFKVADFFNGQRLASILNGLVIWAVLHAWLVTGGYSRTIGIELMMGFVGTAAVFAFSVFLSRVKFAKFVAYCGQNSISIFLSYFIFMAATRIVLLRFAADIDPALISIIVTFSGIVGPLMFHRLVQGTPMAYLYKRHKLFQLSPTPSNKRAETKISVDEASKAAFNAGHKGQPMA